MSVQNCDSTQVMQVEEYVALFHIVNLYLTDMFKIAISIIENQLVKLNKCTPLFHANLARL